MAQTPHPDRTAAEIDAAEATARILLETEAVLFRPDNPFTFTSGRLSPVYVDCRRLISFPRARRKLMDMGADLIERRVGCEIPGCDRRRRDRRHPVRRLDRRPAIAADALCAEAGQGFWPQRADRRRIEGRRRGCYWSRIWRARVPRSSISSGRSARPAARSAIPSELCSSLTKIIDKPRGGLNAASALWTTYNPLIDNASP